MFRYFRTIAAMSLAAGSAFLAMPASAAPTTGPISAFVELVVLSGGDPYQPSGNASLELRNVGTTAIRAKAVLQLPTSSVTVAAGPCTPAAESFWICGGDVLVPGATKTYPVKLRSTTGEPVFGVQALGYVQGQAPDGSLDQRRDFTIAWPDKLPLKLAATAGPKRNGRVDVAVKVTNAGSFTLGGYYLVVETPAGVRTVSPAGSGSGRIPTSIGREIRRSHLLPAGRTDAFTVRLAVQPASADVTLSLTPTNRYTNRDTRLTLKVGSGTVGTSGSAGGAPVTGGARPTLPVTGARSGVLAGAAGLLVAGGLGLVLVGLRRRHRFES